jgi:hypothetical protein
MLNIAALLGKNWKIDSSVKVTSTNQLSLSTDLPDACELKTKAKQVKSASSYGYASYAPPVGWNVYYVSKPSGSGSEATYVEDSIWEDPINKKVWSVTSCAKGVSSGEELKVVVQKKTNHTWILLAALAGLAFITFSD